MALPPPTARPLVNRRVPPLDRLLRLDMLQLRPRLMQEHIRIRLGHEPPLIRLLHVPLIALFFRKRHRIVSCLELKLRALHEVAGRLPAHERVLPAVAFAQYIPVHAPGVGAPGARLGGGLDGFVDSAYLDQF